ncbi:hypothetical protein C3730_25230, partial [Salmonella enterica]
VAVISQSLWLSAFAVAALLFWYQWFPCPACPTSRAGRLLVELAHLQLGITLLLMPLQIALFHGISLTSFAANLFAVPLVTFVSVPLILAGMVVHLTGPLLLEGGLWYRRRDLAKPVAFGLCRCGAVILVPMVSLPRLSHI